MEEYLKCGFTVPGYFYNKVKTNKISRYASASLKNYIT